jgi:DNA (cytosine-5)-methyltransferase 1
MIAEASIASAASFIDLCCGCGGFTRGLLDAGLHHVAGIDLDPIAIKTYEANFPTRGRLADIRSLTLDRHAADILVAGLPCQGHSTLGKLTPRDARNKLWIDFARIVEHVEPWAGAVENVVPFLHSHAFRQLENRLLDMGYLVVSGIVSGPKFGVAQRRDRALLLFGMGEEPRIPEGNGTLKPTVRDAFAGLPVVPDGVNDHRSRRHGALARRRYPHVPEGGSRKDLPSELQSECWVRIGHRGATNSFGRLWWDRPADTIRTSFLKPETGRFIHPSEHRGLTVREGARLQGFPDDFKFQGGLEEQARQIGNAMPPPIAWAVGQELRQLVERSRGGAGPADCQRGNRR